VIKSVNNYPVSQLFDIEAGVVYAIPRYQREYTWKMDQWESLFDDVEENDPGYFLGSIICINQTTDTLAVQRLEVVDGQQRLTTLSLLFRGAVPVAEAAREGPGRRSARGADQPQAQAGAEKGRRPVACHPADSEQQPERLPRRLV
jgi:hypothetical protein